jgi:hypothetical protein
MTSIEYLQKEYNENKGFLGSSNFEQAIKMHKAEIIDAANQNQFDDIAAMGKPIIRGEQYYNETCGSKGSDERIVDTNKTITEISDEEIEFAGTNAWVEYNLTVSDDAESFYAGWKLALKWYREQLKSK